MFIDQPSLTIVEVCFQTNYMNDLVTFLGHETNIVHQYRTLNDTRMLKLLRMIVLVMTVLFPLVLMNCTKIAVFRIDTIT